jgi:hypothetical protein
MRRVPELAILGSIALSLAVPRAAAADEPSRPADQTVAMLSAQIGGDADPELRLQLQEAVRRGLTAAGYSLVDHDTLRRALRDSELIDCTSKTCLSQISEQLNARHFLRAKVEASGAAYSLTLELLDLEGAVVRTLDESCAVCTITELIELIGTTAEEVMTTRETRPVPVLVISQPEGAELTVGDRSVGRAPWSGELPPGEHEVAAHLAGHSEAVKTIEVTTSHETQRFEIILAPVKGPVDEPKPTRPFRTWKWVAAGAGGAALVTGVVLIAIDGSGTCDTGGAECPEEYQSMGAGIASVSVGVAAGAASVWMFLRDRDDAERARAAVVPTRGGAMATVGWRF